MIGTLAGSYKITDLINVGGMGSVYRAEHTLIGRTAAVKVLHPEMSASRDIVNRFFNEARVTTSIKHPGIVEVYDFGYLESGHAYLVMEFLEGMPLSTRNKQRGPIPEGEAAAILKGVCSALAAAHAKGVVHRDLKPDNIFMLPDPDTSLGVRPKLLDFGIAKLTEPGLASSATKTGAVMGTPTYMSPEQCRGTGNVDHRADLYALGCMFYELLAGRPPFIDRGAGELIGAHLFVNPDPPSRFVQGISPDTEALIMSLLSKQPSERPQTATELGQRLAAIAQRTGWGSSTSWEQRPSVANMQAQANALHPTPAHFTPVHATPHFTPANAPTQPSSGLHSAPQPYTSGGHPRIPPGTPGPTQPSEKPTTLSGAASHSIATAPRSSSKWVIPAVALVALIGGGIAIFAVQGGKKTVDHATSAPASGSSPRTKKLAPSADKTKRDTPDPAKAASDRANAAGTDATDPTNSATTPTSGSVTTDTATAADPTKAANPGNASDPTADPTTAEDSTNASAAAKTANTSSTDPTTASDMSKATATTSSASSSTADVAKSSAAKTASPSTDATKTASTRSTATDASKSGTRSTSTTTSDATKASTKTTHTSKTADTTKTATKRSTTKKSSTKKPSTTTTTEPLLETDL